MEKIYLDNAATTPLLPEVIDAMVDAMKETYGNPSSTHSFGQQAKSSIEEVRRQIAQYLRVDPAEIIFTSCGTESNNLIIQSCVKNAKVKRIISSFLEHKCVMESVLNAKKYHDVEVCYLKTNTHGEFNLQELEHLLKSSEKKTLVTLMHANNEIGNLLDIDKVSKLCIENNALFHSDTVQTMAHLDLDFSSIKLDFASCSAHKFHGPKGSGFAFIRKGTGLKACILGGPQERSLRSGTENVCGIVGLGKAFQINIDNLSEFSTHMQDIKTYAIDQLTEKIKGLKFNGKCTDKNQSLFSVLSVLLPKKLPLIGLELDMKGIAISQGSACSSGAASASMVMRSLIDDETLEQSSPLRISFSHRTQKSDIDCLVQALQEILKN